jgi:hypothetical protein
MDGRVIPLSHARGPVRQRPGLGEAAEEISVLSVELRPVDASASALSGEVVDRIHERCVRAALVVAGRRGGRLVLAGTSSHPVVEARFRGAGAGARAAHAAVEIATAVREAQRSDESHLAACVGIGVGEASMSSIGVRITRGSPSRVAELLRQGAGPNDALIGGDAAAEPACELGGTAARALTIDPVMPEVPVWRLPAPERGAGDGAEPPPDPD